MNKNYFILQDGEPVKVDQRTYDHWMNETGSKYYHEKLNPKKNTKIIYWCQGDLVRDEDLSGPIHIFFAMNDMMTEEDYQKLIDEGYQEDGVDLEAKKEYVKNYKQSENFPKESEELYKTDSFADFLANNKVAPPVEGDEDEQDDYDFEMDVYDVDDHYDDTMYSFATWEEALKYDGKHEPL